MFVLRRTRTSPQCRPYSCVSTIYQVDHLHQQHPNWTGEQLYENAKAIVTAEIANITYNEFLPHLLGPDAIAPYQGYDPSVDPTITEEFAGAAYRFGHSIVSGELEQINEFGVLTNDQALQRRVLRNGVSVRNSRRR